MPRIKPKIKIKYVIYNAEDPRSIEKIDAMLFDTDFHYEERSGQVLIRHDRGGDGFTLENGHVFYIVKTLYVNAVAVAKQKDFFDTFKKAFEKKEKKQANAND